MAEAVEKINDIERRVKVIVPIAPYQGEISQKFQQLTKTARVQGFRPGKVPLKIVEQQYGGDVKSEVYTNCLLYTSPSPRDGLLSRMPSSA